MIPDSGIPHCWVAVNVDTARGNIVGSACVSDCKLATYQSNIFAGKDNLKL